MDVDRLVGRRAGTTVGSERQAESAQPAGERELGAARRRALATLVPVSSVPAIPAVPVSSVPVSSVPVSSVPVSSVPVSSVPVSSVTVTRAAASALAARASVAGRDGGRDERGNR